MTNKRLTFYFAIFSLVIVAFFSSCKKEIKPNFTVNSVSLPSRDNMPTNETDTFNIMTVYVGDELLFEDASEPVKAATKWDWDLDGDGVSNTEEARFPVTFPKEGHYKVTLCVNNDKDHTVTKIIYAIDRPASDAPVADTPRPRPTPTPTPTYKPKPMVMPKAIVVAPPVYVPPPPAAPVVPTKKSSYSAKIAFPRGASDNCGSFDKSSFSITLGANEDCDLTSVFLWSDAPGTAKIKLSGNGEDQTDEVSLIAGRPTQISLSDFSLQKGVKYTLSFQAKSKGDDEPKFRNGASCGLKPDQSDALSIIGNYYLYDLKFTYRK
jgi:PKD repeat protein